MLAGHALEVDDVMIARVPAFKCRLNCVAVLLLCVAVCCFVLLRVAVCCLDVRVALVLALLALLAFFCFPPTTRTIKHHIIQIEL